MNETRRVMVIDDDSGLREILTLALEAEGYDVSSASDGARGLEMLAHRPADVVIVDMRMPEVDGTKFCRLYAKQRDGGGPVILMTAMARGAAEAGLPGVVDCVAKPFNLGELLAVVARVVAPSERSSV